MRELIALLDANHLVQRAGWEHTYTSQCSLPGRPPLALHKLLERASPVQHAWGGHEEPRSVQLRPEQFYSSFHGC